MSRLVSIDGILVSPEDAKVSVYDRAFLYGDSVFETLRTYRGVPFALDEHMDRLERSAARVAIAMPLSKDAFAEEIRRTMAAAGNAESSSRIMLSRGSGPLGLDPSSAGPPLRVIFVEPLKMPPSALYREGASAITHRIEHAADAVQGAKVGNYLASVLAMRAAIARGAHEALITDAAGHVIEGTTSNLFVVRRARLVTPPEEEGILPGITRAHILRIAEQMRIPIDLASILLDELYVADELFVSSSIREILPVVRVDDRPIGNGSPGPITRALHAAFRRHVGLADVPPPWA